MEISLVYDVIFVFIGLMIVLRCWRAGLVASVIRLVGTLAAYLGAWLLAAPASQFLYDRFVHRWLVEYTQSRIPDQLNLLAGSAAGLVDTLGLEQVTELLRNYLEPLLGELSLGGVTALSRQDAGSLSGSLLDRLVGSQATLAESLVETLLHPGVSLLLQLACFAILCGLLTMVVHLLIRLARGVNYVPLVGGLNHLLGGGVGIAEALLVVYLLCIVLTIASVLLGESVSWLDWGVVSGSRTVQAALGLKLPGGLSLLS